MSNQPPSNLNELATLVYHYLIENDCIVPDDAYEEVTNRKGEAVRKRVIPQNAKTRLEIANACGFEIEHFMAVKLKMLDMGYEISMIPGVGHFIGEPGERVRSFLFADALAQSWQNTSRRFYSTMAKHNAKDIVEFMRKHPRYKNLDWYELVEREHD